MGSAPLSIETPRPNLASPWRWSISPEKVKANAGEMRASYTDDSLPTLSSCARSDAVRNE